MANALYGLARQSFLSQSPSIDMDTDAVKMHLVDAGAYTVSIDVNQYMNTNTVAAAAKIGAAQTLGSKTITLGVFDAADLVFTAITGTSIENLIGWKDGGGGGTSASGTTDILIWFIDTATGLPVTPNGGDINVVFDSGANRIFKL